MTAIKDTLVHYQQNGERKSAPQQQVIAMLESIAEQDMRRALVHYHKLTQENPEALDLLWRFYEKLLGMYMFEELLELSSQRLVSRPKCAIAFSWKLDALRHMFRHQEAIDMLRQAYLDDPTDYNAVTILGTFYKDEGDFEKALASFNQAIEINPDYAPPYWHRSDLSSDAEQDYAEITDKISAGKVHESRAHYFQFAAYRAAEKLGDLATAFEHLSFGNGLKRHQLNYDLAHEVAVDDKAKEVFNPNYLAQLQAQAQELKTDPPRPIFILGMPRSGTTLVEQIIASHSQVAGGDEYTALANAVMRVQRLGADKQASVDQWLATRQSKDWAKIAKAYIDNMRFIRGDKMVFTDKNQFNHRSIGVIAAAMPDAKIIVVDRQPMDVLFGCYRQLFGDKGAPFSYDYQELVGLYQSYNQLIDYWCEHTNNLIKRVKYEDLVRQPQQTTDELLQFCGLRVERACYDFHKTQRSVKTLSSTQVRQPIFTQGINRWKRYETQLDGLIELAERAGIQIT